jgi:hypothetical protein
MVNVFLDTCMKIGLLKSFKVDGRDELTKSRYFVNIYVNVTKKYTVQLKILIKIFIKSRQVLVAHTCNLSYPGSRDQEDGGSKPTWANSSRDPISKRQPHHKKGWWSGSR